MPSSASTVIEQSSIRALISRGPVVAVGIDRFLAQKTLAAMLAVCLALIVEEALHLQRSHANAAILLSSTHHPGCQPLDASGRLFRCDIKGYGGMVFLCSKKGCRIKEPATGRVLTPAEKRLFDVSY
jgi:hypothetical protein